MLKHGDTFAVFDCHGNIRQIGLGEQGLYHEGTRFLRRLELRVMDRRPLLLSSTVNEDNAVLTVDLTNPDIHVDGNVVLPRDTVHIFRSCFLWRGACYERLRVRNYGLQPIDFSFSLLFEADFCDVFEVRGLKRARRGEMLPALVNSDLVELGYRGLDDQERRTTIEFSPIPKLLQAAKAEYAEQIPPHGERCFFITITCQPPNGKRPSLTYVQALAGTEENLRTFRAHDAAVQSSSGPLNSWLNRSAVDLHLMVTHTPHGPYPYAGVPWFSTVFGRDGILTAMEFLWVNPELARGVLQYLAANQAQKTEPERDAEPGKILHEVRGGEMAALGEIPFGRYYGSVDATPLFVMLAGAYYDRTDDVPLIQSIWPNVEAALEWIDRFGDIDGDGFVEYHRQSHKGLVVQGWKDSHDSVFHADGTLAEGPVALCEVQGYVYAARRAAAFLARRLGHPQRADQLMAQSEDLRRRFEDAFWCNDLSTYALALDGRKKPCHVRTSNSGHCLFTGITTPERAVRVADSLLGEDSFSGWGIRTVSEIESRYNPMSYHNGSVWPHDNAIIAAGLARYHLTRHVQRIFSGLCDASQFVDMYRMPELFCGFVRRPGIGPTLYPVACSPQSWAGAAVFSLLQSLLGLTIDAPRRQIRFVRSTLPEGVDQVWIRNLRVADSVIDFSVERFPMDVGIELLRRDGDVEIAVLK